VAPGNRLAIRTHRDGTDTVSKGGSQSTSVQVDPRTQQYVDQLRRYAQTAAGQPGQVPGALNQAQQGLQGYAQAGQLGLGALTGQPGAVQSFMNPYQSQLDPFFAQQRSQAVNAANDQATLAGAFGGDRSAIGAATAGNLADQNAAAFRYGGFNDAMQRALTRLRQSPLTCGPAIRVASLILGWEKRFPISRGVAGRSKPSPHSPCPRHQQARRQRLWRSSRS
jgi:hypothetical protein